MASLGRSLFGPILSDETVARDFASLILKHAHGEAELTRQQPLQVTDAGEDWLIKGSVRPGERPEDATWQMRVRKADCMVKDSGHVGSPLEIPEEYKAMVQAALRSKPTD
jgi:hypothetical protein